ncbi:MAG: ABC transporter ATP-binding protein [Firmicutes bacterium]|jgi:ABC-type nitrate/sulfonate/bicarbonate transport system ATPase subunit|nr:ABC transporter ATP-binding protein [Bacillota bacterium]
MKEIIKIDKVSMSFDGKEVFENINLHIYENQLISIVGKSGIGKSTLLRILGGFESTYTGKLIMKDKISLDPDRDRLMIFQDFDQLFPWKKLIDNVMFPMIKLLKLDKNQAKSQALRYLEMVGLKDQAEKYPRELSGGMKQRGAIARALALKPKVLLMDEPFGSLDMITRESLQELILKLKEELDMTIIFVTHDLREAVRISDRIVLLKDDGVMEITGMESVEEIKGLM